MRALQNQINALKSRGAKTFAGLAQTRRNALKHGLLAKDCVMSDEDEADFEAFRDVMLAELRPVGAVEKFLVARIVTTMWRLRRIPRIEREMVVFFVERCADWVRSRRKDPHARITLGDVFADDSSGRDAFAKLRRYETHFERALARDLHELERRQRARQGDDVPAPQAVDVNVTIDGGPESAEDAA
jgi:hypothetical protein